MLSQMACPLEGLASSRRFPWLKIGAFMVRGCTPRAIPAGAAAAGVAAAARGGRRAGAPPASKLDRWLVCRSACAPRSGVPAEGPTQKAGATWAPAEATEGSLECWCHALAVSEGTAHARCRQLLRGSRRAHRSAAAFLLLQEWPIAPVTNPLVHNIQTRFQAVALALPTLNHRPARVHHAEQQPDQQCSYQGRPWGHWREHRGLTRPAAAETWCVHASGIAPSWPAAPRFSIKRCK